MSLLVVINGPVANAGSIPNLSNNNGIKVPINEAIIITETNAIVTITPIITSTFTRAMFVKYLTVKDRRLHQNRNLNVVI